MGLKNIAERNNKVLFCRDSSPTKKVFLSIAPFKFHDHYDIEFKTVKIIDDNDLIMDVTNANDYHEYIINALSEVCETTVDIKDEKLFIAFQTMIEEIFQLITIKSRVSSGRESILNLYPDKGIIVKGKFDNRNLDNAFYYDFKVDFDNYIKYSEWFEEINYTV